MELQQNRFIVKKTLHLFCKLFPGTITHFIINDSTFPPQSIKFPGSIKSSSSILPRSGPSLPLLQSVLSFGGGGVCVCVCGCVWVCVCTRTRMLSSVQVFSTPWTVTCQAPTHISCIGRQILDPMSHLGSRLGSLLQGIFPTRD